MHVAKEGDPTQVKRTSDREYVVTRSFNAPVRLVFEAWSKPELFQRWWVPKSAGMTLLSCAMDVRTGGSYRLEFKHPATGQPMAFFGKYLDVKPNARISWTNEESGEGAVSTVTMEEKNGQTHLVFHELYPSKEALDQSFEGMEGSMGEQFLQLDDVLATLA
jgi:uncharacterized protein YndB with AHSA1/START domain